MLNDEKVFGKGIDDKGVMWRKYSKFNAMVYREWYEMLRRCYSEEYQEEHPEHRGYTVCDRWLTLSNFAKDVKRINGFNKKDFIAGKQSLSVKD